MLRVLVVDSSRERAADVCAALALAGHQVAAVLTSALDLSDQVLATKPDVIFIQADSPSRDTLEHLATMNRDCPRPVLLFSQDSDSTMIRRAVKAGVSSYVVDSVSVERLDSLVEVAIAQFEEFQTLRAELDDANRKLSERIVVDKAKGLLMKARGLDEGPWRLFLAQVADHQHAQPAGRLFKLRARGRRLEHHARLAVQCRRHSG